MKRRLRLQSTINITPYIDILLVLLIIFMVITPQTAYNMGARSTAAGKGGSANVLVLTIDADAQVTLNSHPVAYSALGEELFRVLSERADKTIFLRGNADLPFGMIARVIDIAKGAGAADVALTVG